MRGRGGEWECQLISKHNPTDSIQQTFPSVNWAQPQAKAKKKRQNRWEASLANWHFAHFWMRQASQFYFHLVWYFCDTLTVHCHSILSKFYYEFFFPIFVAKENCWKRRSIWKIYFEFPLSVVSRKKVVLRKISQFVWFMFRASIKYASFQFAVERLDSWHFYDGDFYSIYCFGRMEVCDGKCFDLEPVLVSRLKLIFCTKPWSFFA